MSYFDEAMSVVKATAPKYIKGATDLTIRRRLVLAMLNQSGNIAYNVKAPKLIWDVECREPRGRFLSGGERSQFTTHDAYEQLEIDHAEFEYTDKMARRTQQLNSNSPQQIVDIGGRIMERLTEQCTKQLGKQFYADNTSGSNTSMLTGIESFMKPHASATATDKIIVPSATATYGGKNIGLGALGGTWSANGTANSSVTANDWPEGSGSAEYDYMAPKMFNYLANWGGSANTWEANSCRILRRSKEILLHTGGEGSAPVAHLLALDLYNAFRDHLEARERLQVSDYARTLGFPDVLTYEGAIVSPDFDCPSGKGYGVSLSDMSLYSVNDQLFCTDGPTWTTEDQASLFLVMFFGNWKWNPKYFAQYRAGV